MSAVRRRFGGCRPAFGGWIDGPGRSVPQSRGGGGAILGRLGENGRLIFLSANAAVSDGADGGAGIGYVDGAGAKSWVTVDGTNWVGIDQTFGLAIEPVLVAADASSASKYGGGAMAREEPVAEAPRFETELQSIAPNPFNPDTEIMFTLRETTRLTVSVFDIGGRRIKNLADGTLAQGAHAVRWDGCDDGGRSAASGVYFVRMTADGKAYSQRMLLVK